MIHCQNQLCIYQNNQKCTQKTISIDSLGRCTECLYLYIPSRELRKLNRKLFTNENLYHYCIPPHPQVFTTSVLKNIFRHPPTPIRGLIKSGRRKKSSLSNSPT